MIIEPLGPDQFKVESVKKPGEFYVVRLSDRHNSCTCPAYEFSGRTYRCKHIGLVLRMIEKGELRRNFK